MPIELLIQMYFDRWQIEVNHREEKDTFCKLIIYKVFLSLLTPHQVNNLINLFVPDCEAVKFTIVPYEVRGSKTKNNPTTAKLLN